MPSISAISSGAITATAPARAAAPKTAATQATSTAVNTADTVSISAETKSELAQGKPFFATAGAEGSATSEAAGLANSEEAAKIMRLEKLESQSDAVSQRGAGKLEKLKKRGPLRADKLGDRVANEAEEKKLKTADQTTRVGGQEERVKSAAADRSELLSERAKKSGVPVDQSRIDRIGDRVKDEAAEKGTRLEAADGRRISREAEVKKRAKDKIGAGDVHTEAQTKRAAGNTKKKLSGLEERMKRIDPARTGGDEQKIKGSATPSTGGATAETEATTKTTAI